MKLWPKIGSKITFKQAHPWFWYKNITQNAKEHLEADKEYTVAALHPASSWCAVELVEHPDLEFALGFFDYQKELTTKELNENK